FGEKFKQEIRHRTISSKSLVAAVAHRFFGRALAGAEPGLFGVHGLVFDRTKGRALVRAVAKRLGLGTPAGAPPIALAAFQHNRDRPPAANFGHCAFITHALFPPPSVASHACPQALASSRTRKT